MGINAISVESRMELCTNCEKVPRLNVHYPVYDWLAYSGLGHDCPWIWIGGAIITTVHSISKQSEGQRRLV